MSEDIKHNCGITVAHTLHDAYSFIKSLQHRGREATGISAIGIDKIDTIKWEGPVDRFDVTDLHKIFPSPDYHTYMAHVRYATKGRKEKILEDAHPHVLGGQEYHKGSHILITNSEMAIIHNGQVDGKFLGSQEECDTKDLLLFYKQKGEYEILRSIPGAYTLAIADKKRKEVIVLRDKTGIKPGVLGWKDGKHCVASEDIALRKNGGDFIEDLEPGAVYYLDQDGRYTKENIVDQDLAHCFFEWNYLADSDSIVNGSHCGRVKDYLGESLANNLNLEADFVTFIPRCPEPAARSFAKKAEIPFEYVFYKTRSERSFQGSTTRERKSSINNNLYLLPTINDIPVEEFLREKTVIVMEDSIVRGNNATRGRDLLLKAGVKQIHLISYTPKIGIIGEDEIPRGCMFGVDMPPEDEFVARNKNLEEISKQMGMDVRYPSLEDMLTSYKKMGIDKNDLCTYCIGGKNPLE